MQWCEKLWRYSLDGNTGHVGSRAGQRFNPIGVSDVCAADADSNDDADDIVAAAASRCAVQ